MRGAVGWCGCGTRLEADLGGCGLADDGFGVAVCLSVWDSSLHLLLLSGSKLAKNTSPVGSGQNKAVLNFLIPDKLSALRLQRG